MIDPRLRADLEARRTGPPLPRRSTRPPLDPTVDYSQSAHVARLDAAYFRATGRARRRPLVNREAELRFYTAPDGYCRVCGDPVQWPRRRWHEPCLLEYQKVASQTGFRHAVWTRDRGRCAACPPGCPPYPRYTLRVFPCGEETEAVSPTCPRVRRYRWDRELGRSVRVDEADEHVCGPPGVVGWEADHVVALIDGGEHSLDNAQTLCIPHHKVKSAREAAARAYRRRLGVG